MVRRRGGPIEKVHSLKCSADWTRMVERCRSPNVDDIHKLQPKYRGKGKLYLSIPCESCEAISALISIRCLRRRGDERLYISNFSIRSTA